ncbi:tyrosine-type recombinase/integrase [Streptomyces sp. NBC_00637]
MASGATRLVSRVGGRRSPPPQAALPPRHCCRQHGETKTRKSRRTIALPKQVVDVLAEHERWQRRARASRGMEWSRTSRVFTTRTGEPLDAANVRRDFKAIVRKAGLNPEWTPRKLRHSSVSLSSDHGIPLETIALLVGHSSQATTEAVYRKQLRPVITKVPKPWTTSSPMTRKGRRRGSRKRAARWPDQLPLAPCLAPRARQRPHTEIRMWPLTCVGVAGFEPTTSSSRIRPWEIVYLGPRSNVQVRALESVGLRLRLRDTDARSSPGILQGSLRAMQEPASGPRIRGPLAARSLICQAARGVPTGTPRGRPQWQLPLPPLGPALLRGRSRRRGSVG